MKTLIIKMIIFVILLAALSWSAVHYSSIKSYIDRQANKILIEQAKTRYGIIGTDS